MDLDLAQSLEAELAKSWRERRAPHLSSLYVAQQARVQRRAAHAAVWLVGVLYVLFIAADFVLIPDVIGWALISRVVIGSIYALGISCQIRRGVPPGIIELQCALGVVAGFAAWFALTMLSEHSANVLYYATYGPVFMMVANLFFNFRFGIAAASSGLITLIFFVNAALFLGAGIEYCVAIGSLYVLSFVLTLFLNWKLDAERYRVFLNSSSAELRHQEARERSEELLKISKTDALTGLANRRATDNVLQMLWTNWTSGEETFAVALIDIDHFKTFNDQYGHQHGDSCLVRVADAMEAVALRHHAKLGRFGGEEFILLHACASSRHARAVAEELRQAVEALGIVHEARGDTLSTVTVSVGVAFSRDIVGSKAERIVTDADRALYLAKNGGRNRVRLFDPSLVEDGSSGDGLHELVRTAIAKGRVSLVYQPILHLGTGGMVGAEALMRLRDEDGSPVSPAAFIPHAERTGLIYELGEWAIGEACRQLRACDHLPLVSVNVSVMQLVRPGFAARVDEILQRTGVLPSRLALEITEGAEIEGKPAVVQAVADLNARGIKVWLDDFGTGFAGLSCLRELRFDAVKVDGSFVRNSGTPRGARLLRDIISLVGNADSRLVVEGIETREQADLLAVLGVKWVQGYHFARPMAADALRRMTVEHPSAPRADVAA